MSAKGLFLIDVYHGNYGDGPIVDLPAMLAAPARAAGLVGVIAKASDGGDAQEWYPKWAHNQLRYHGASDRLGSDWFAGSYHFLRWRRGGSSGSRQADVYVANHGRCADWTAPGQLLPAVDIEGVDPGTPKSQVLDAAVGFIRRVKELTGQPVMVYGRGFYKETGIKWSELGGVVGWNPSYTALERQLPVPRAQALLWQYTNGEVNKTSFPTSFPGVRPHDVSVYKGTIAGGSEMLDLRKFQAHLETR